MTWQMIVLIAIGASVLLTIGFGVLFWSIWNKTTKQMNNMVDDMGKSLGFEGLEDRVARLTGPGPNPFDALRKKSG